VNAFLFER
jgi:hypothetical protein